MLTKKLTILLFLVISPVLLFPQTNLFNADSTYAYIEHLSVNIGPRPMGSLNEQTALRWTFEKFNSFGADSSFIMKFTTAKSERRSYNTNSGNAVAIFKGKTDSAIVIGGHIDSAEREIPGANDNASGTATVIELARIWSQRALHYTMIFVAFGGEERGLLGSNHFINQYPDLNDIVLMFSLDMTGSDDLFEVTFETNLSQAPDWLVKDAFSIENTLGMNRLQYPTQYETLNNLSSQGSGSDHQSFLNKGIPGISFTAGISNSPIHRQEDKLEFISNPVLAEYGSFVDKLLVKYQTEGIPTRQSDRFMLLQVFGILICIPIWFITVFNIMAFGLGIWAFIVSRNNRLLIEKADRIRFSGLKLLLMFVIIIVFTHFGEALMQLLKGLRYPWMIHVDKYLWLGALWGLLGLWCSLQLTKKWRFSPDQYVYAKRALIIIALFTVFSALLGMRLAVYPAFILFLISLVILIPDQRIKIILSIIAPIPMFKLMFTEAFTFFARALTSSGMNIDTFGKAFLLSSALVVFFVIWYITLIYFYSHILVTIKPVKKITQYFRKPVFGLALLLVIIGYSGFLYFLPAYNEMWKPRINVTAEYDINENESNLEIRGNEYFKDVMVQTDSMNEVYNTSIHKLELPNKFTADWFKIDGDIKKKSGEKDSLDIDWNITSTHPWYSVSLEIVPDTLKLEDINSDLIYTENNNRIRYTWFADPPDSLNVAAQFAVHPGAKLIRKVSATYPEMPVFINVESPAASVRYRTRVTYEDTLVVN